MKIKSLIFSSKNVMSVVLTIACFIGNSSFASEIVDDEMVTVPAGEFLMGCDPDMDPVCESAPDELRHSVYLNEFEIDKYEVNYRRYQKCIDADKCSYPASRGGFNYDLFKPNFPVNGVNWHQAKAMCEFEGKRLPTEAEWEKAARGINGQTFPWGEELPSCERAVVDGPNAGELGCKTGNVLDIGSKPAGVSPYGAMDMAGNVWEWVADWHDAEYFQSSPFKNPKGPETGNYKVTKGGDFFGRHGYEVRASSRFPYDPINISPAIGFRCAKSI